MRSILFSIPGGDVYSQRKGKPLKGLQVLPSVTDVGLFHINLLVVFRKPEWGGEKAAGAQGQAAEAVAHRRPEIGVEGRLILLVAIPVSTVSDTQNASCIQREQPAVQLQAALQAGSCYAIAHTGTHIQRAGIGDAQAVLVLPALTEFGVELGGDMLAEEKAGIESKIEGLGEGRGGADCHKKKEEEGSVVHIFRCWMDDSAMIDLVGFSFQNKENKNQRVPILQILVIFLIFSPFCITKSSVGSVTFSKAIVYVWLC